MFSNSFLWTTGVLSISWTIYGWEQYLAYRQHVRLADPSLGVPSLLQDVVSEEDHTKAKAYGRDKSSLEFVTNLFNQLVTTFTIVYGLLPMMWAFSRDVLYTVGLVGEREIMQSIIFVMIYLVVSSLTAIPFSWYRNFVIEERYGFNKLTVSLWLSDKLKEMLVMAAISAPFVAGILGVIKWGGDNFFYYVFIFVLIFQIIMILLFPTVIAPLFNTFNPLAEGPLKSRIAELAKRVDFPLTKVFVIDGSKRTSHSNAYFTGLFSDKRIVLYDTLLDNQTTEEILAVLAHELGHWKLSHILRTLIVSQTHLFVLFYTFSHFIHSSPMYEAFGFHGEHPILIGLSLFAYVYQPVDSVMAFAMNYMSRVHEFQADAYAKKLGYAEDLKRALIKMNQKSYGNLVPDSWYSSYHYSHPPLVERLTAIGKTE
ncbi:CAAX prenyl protease 1 [Rhizoclosmatium sp. JEL0117]|nr:CAAX prenyl protease 1 [Rhizoclosmatium sp. JEL0117]